MPKGLPTMMKVVSVVMILASMAAYHWAKLGTALVIGSLGLVLLQLIAIEAQIILLLNHLKGIE